MQKWGKDRSGRQRYRCRKCGISGFRERKDIGRKAKFRLFNDWLLGNASLNEISKAQKVHRSTLYRWFLEFKIIPVKQKRINIEDKVIIIDGTYLGKHKGQRIAVLVVKTTTQVVKWRFCSKECFESWRETLRHLHRPKAIVCDGQKGMAGAIDLFWANMTIQRCLFHIERFCLSKLTLHPSAPSDQALRQLCLQICHLDTTQQRDQWFEDYTLWKWKNEQFLHEKITYLHPINDKLVSVYSHKKTRQVITTIDNGLPNMFAYLADPDIPRTSNHIEGGTNSRLKELIYRHRGTTAKRKVTLTNQYLSKQQIRAKTT